MSNKAVPFFRMNTTKNLKLEFSDIEKIRHARIECLGQLAPLKITIEYFEDPSSGFKMNSNLDIFVSAKYKVPTEDRCEMKFIGKKPTKFFFKPLDKYRKRFTE